PASCTRRRASTGWSLTRTPRRHSSPVARSNRNSPKHCKLTTCLTLSRHHDLPVQRRLEFDAWAAAPQFARGQIESKLAEALQVHYVPYPFPLHGSLPLWPASCTKRRASTGWSLTRTPRRHSSPVARSESKLAESLQVD